MEKQIKFLLIILFFSFTISCTNAQTSIHEKDLKYYATIALQMEDFGDDSDSGLKILKQAEKTKTGIVNDTLLYHKIDSLLTNLNSEIDIRIKKIEQLENNVDDEYKLKEIVLSFLMSEKESLQKMFEIYRIIMKKGITALTELQKADLKKYIENQQKLQIERQKIEKLFSKFQIHHDITVNELEKYGL